ncbi:MAG: hypothetical protein LW832_02245 [Parachlamydia sp.]|jgi:hypothetical protein|nr:hypothetical protein [Parachlamydia sp.]
MEPTRDIIPQYIQQNPPIKESQNTDLVDALEQSTTLFHSCIENDLMESTQNASNTIMTGQTILNHMNTLHTTTLALKDIYRTVRDENTNLVTTGFTLFSGITSLLNGHTFAGLGLSATAAHQLLRIYNNHGLEPSSTQNLIKDMHASILLTKQMNESQNNTVLTIERHVQAAQLNLIDIKDKFNHIEQLATEGLASGEEKKQQAIGAYEKAESNYNEATGHFDECRRNMLNLMNISTNIINEFEELVHSLQSQTLDEEAVSELISKSLALLKNMQELLSLVDSTQRHLNEGLDYLDNAATIMCDAQKLHLEAEHTMQMHFYTIQHEAHREKEVRQLEANLNKAQEQVNEYKDVGEVQKKVIENAEMKIRQAEENENKRWGERTQMIGGAALLAGGIVGGVAVGAPVGYVAASVFHYVRRMEIFSTLVNNAPTIELADNENFKVTYSPVSSGPGGYVAGLFTKFVYGVERPSYTVGTATIRVGDQVFEFKFSKKTQSKNGKLDENDMRILNELLMDKLEQRKVSPQEVIDLLDSLKQVKTNHNDYINLINKSSVYFLELRRRCKKLIKESG